VQAPLWNAHVFGHRSIHAVAKAAPRGIQIIKAASAQRGRFVDHRGGFTHHPIAFLELCDPRARFGDRT
jgi:hypothetical protein